MANLWERSTINILTRIYGNVLKLVYLFNQVIPASAFNSNNVITPIHAANIQQAHQQQQPQQQTQQSIATSANSSAQQPQMHAQSNQPVLAFLTYIIDLFRINKYTVNHVNLRFYSNVFDNSKRHNQHRNTMQRSNHNQLFHKQLRLRHKRCSISSRKRKTNGL